MMGLRRTVWLAGMLALLTLTALLGRMRLRTPQAAQALGLPAGWNLIADPNGIVTTGPAFTFQIGAALPLSDGIPTATLLTQPGKYIMIGDPSGVLPALVSGADILITFDPVGGYHFVTNGILQPGQGAWALSFRGTPISLVAQGTSTSSCSLTETGSACPVNGACPQDYPVAITSDAVAHPQPGQGDPALQQPAVLCFNSMSQALSAGYSLAPATRLTLSGPVSATVSGVTFTVLRAVLESPDAFMARVLASGDELCSGCDVSGATAVITVDYGVENLDRPPTLISTGKFVSEHPPAESSPSYFLLQSQQAVDPVHTGVPVSGAISGVFTRSPFATIDQVNWRLDDPLIDSLNGVAQPHGPSVLFELDFRGPLAGQILAYGAGSAPQPPYNPNGQPPPPIVIPTPAATALPGGVTLPLPATTPIVPAVAPPPASPAPASPAPAPGASAPAAAPTFAPVPGPSAPTPIPPGTTPAAGAINPSAPFTR
jgi:hypothetical protein